MRKPARIVEAILIGLLAFAASCLYGQFQQQTTHNAGYGDDGASYARMYYSARGEATDAQVLPSVANPPFCKRIAVPLLAAWMPGADAAAKIKAISIASGVIAVVAVYLVARRRVDVVRSAAVCLPLVAYVFAPLRVSHYFVWTIDPASIALLALAALAFETRSVGLGLAMIVIGIPVKESLLFFSLLGVLCFLWSDGAAPSAQKLLRTAVAVIAIGIASLLYKIADPACGSGSMAAVREWFVLAISDPWRILVIAAAIALTLGPFVRPGKIAAPDAQDSADPAMRFAQLSLFLAVAMACFGGADSTRIFLICYPAFMPLLVRWVASWNGFDTVYFSFGGLVANRWLTPLPDFVTRFDLFGWDGAMTFYPDHANPAVALAILAYFVALHACRPLVEAAAMQLVALLRSGSPEQ